MAALRLRAYGVAAGLAVVTASGIVGVAAVALGVSISPCGAGGAGCAPEERAAASVAAVPADDSGVEAAVLAEPATAELPRRGPQAVDAAAAAVMADQIEMASISVAPALPTAATETRPAATAAAALRSAPLPVPGPLAAMGVLDEDAEQVVASELSVVPSDAARSALEAVTVGAGPSTPGVAAATGMDSGEVATAPPAAVELAVAPRPSAAPDREPEPEPQAAPAIRTVAGAGVNVRSGPSNGSGKLFALAGGTTVEVTGEDRGWLNVVDAEGRSGWAYSEFFD